MGGQSSADYHRARAARELQRAEEASDPKTAALHRELAELHRLSAELGDESASADPPEGTAGTVQLRSA